MFVVLDTNHYGELTEESPIGENLRRRLVEAEADVFTTIVTAQEAMQGWLAEINRRKSGGDQIEAYRQFHKELEALSNVTLLDFDEDAARRFHELRSLKLKGGPMDLKIAAICLVHNALLLTRNLVHFRDVPGLNAENWLD